jgi:hypothetical protein
MEESAKSRRKFNYPALDFSQPLPPWPDHWGRWTLDAEHLVLSHEVDYDVDLQRFSSCAPMLDMITQVRNKTFMTTTDVGDLVAALDDIFDIHSKLSRSGVDRSIEDVPAYIRQRIASHARAD